MAALQGQVDGLSGPQEAAVAAAREEGAAEARATQASLAAVMASASAEVATLTGRLSAATADAQAHAERCSFPSFVIAEQSFCSYC